MNQLVTRAEVSALERRICDRIDQLGELVRSMNLRLFVPGDRKADGEPREFYSPAEFARIIGVSKNTVIRRCQDGTYRSTQPGGEGTAILIPCTEVDRIRKRAESLH